MRAELPADLTSARQARAAIRQALAAWRMDHLSGDAELLASELVANAAEHGDGKPIGLALRRHAEPGGRPGITCEVTDTAPGHAPAPGTRPGRRARPGPGDRRRAGPTPAACAPARPARPAGSPSPSPTAPTGSPGRSSTSPKPARNPRPPKEDTTMPHPANDPERAGRASAAPRRRAVTGLARDRGAEFTTRPMVPGSDMTVRDLEPLDRRPRRPGHRARRPARRPRLRPRRARSRARLGRRSARPSASPRTPTPTRPG